MKNEALQKLVTMIVLLLAGIFLLGIGIHLLTQNLGSYVETTATITRVEGISILSKAYVSYTADGKLYEDVPLSSMAATDRVGTELIIYYDPDDPAVIEPQGGSNWAKYSTMLGAVLIIYSVVTVVRNRKTLFAAPAKGKKK